MSIRSVWNQLVLMLKEVHIGFLTVNTLCFLIFFFCFITFCSNKSYFLDNRLYKETPKPKRTRPQKKKSRPRPKGSRRSTRRSTQVKEEEDEQEEEDTEEWMPWKLVSIIITVEGLFVEFLISYYSRKSMIYFRFAFLKMIGKNSLKSSRIAKIPMNNNSMICYPTMYYLE